MAKPSIYQCCLDSKFSNYSSCSGSFKLDISSDSSSDDDNPSRYVYTNCDNIFGDSKKSGEDDNYGWDNHKSDYNSEYSDAKNPAYAYHSTNDQVTTKGGKPKKNIRQDISNITKINELYGGMETNHFNASIKNKFSDNILLDLSMNFCNHEPYKYDNPIICNSVTDTLLDLKNSYDSIANGSDICEYTYESGKLTDTLETIENCENKYFEYSIDTPYNLGIDSDTNLPYYPSFTKHVKCRWNGTKCTMSKGSDNSASLVNECLIDNNCTKDNFINDKCKQDEFIDSYLANKGYNKEYSNLCSCKYNNIVNEYDNSSDDNISSAIYKKMCKKLGFEENAESGSDYFKCITAAETAFQNDLRDSDTHKLCMNFYYPCKNAIINQKCDESQKESDNIIQICSNVIDSNTAGNIDAKQNVSCTQAINKSCGGECNMPQPKQKPEQKPEVSKDSYKCSGAPDYKCSQVDSGKGDYDTLEQCNTSCVNPEPPSASLIYKCSGSPDFKCSKVDAGTGKYDTLEQCNSSCTSSTTPTDGLSTFEIVGIVLGCILLIILAVYLSKKYIFTKVEASPKTP